MFGHWVQVSSNASGTQKHPNTAKNDLTSNLMESFCSLLILSAIQFYLPNHTQNASI